MNKREAAIVSAYTGFLIGDFSEMHKYAEELFVGPVWTHQFGDKGFSKKLREMAKADFVAIEIEE